MTPFLKGTAKVHQLFKAFHAHNLPNKRDLCDILSELIEKDAVRGSAQIDVLLKMLLEEEIYAKELEEAICKVLGKEPMNHNENHEDDLDIQLAQRVPEIMDNEEEDEHVHHYSALSNKDKAEVARLCKTLSDQLKKMENACLHKCPTKACDEMSRMKIFFDHYFEVINFIVHN